MTRRLQASEESTESAAGEQQHKHRRVVRVAKVLALGGVVALVTKDDLRSRLLDAVFGPEEQFEYDSVTEPVAPGIEPEGTGMFRPGAAEEASEVETPDDELWSIPTSDAEAASSVSVANDPSAASDEARYPGASAIDTATEEPPAHGHDSAASDYAATAGEHDTPAQDYESAAPSYDSPAAADEAPADAYDAPADEPPTAAYDAPTYGYDTPAAVYEAPAQADDAPAEVAAPAADDWPASTYEAPVAPEQTPAAAHEAPAGGDAPPASTFADVARGYDAPSPAVEVGEPAETDEPPAYGGSEPTYSAPSVESPSYEAPHYEAPAVEAPSYQAPAVETASYQPPPSPYEYPVYDAPLAASDAPPQPNPAFDDPAGGDEGAAATAAEGDQAPPSDGFESSPAAAVETTEADAPAEPEASAEPEALAEPEASAEPEALAEPEASAELEASAEPEASAEQLEQPPVEAAPPAEEIPPAAEPAAEGGEPALGEAAPGESATRRSGWWVPRRRNRSGGSAPEPPRWE